ncbi:DUF983 domain-containing protein [Olivibacter sp. SDN3]|uniref:DUF983 domain-containing protein n=1 Tax=Olivibacter sp. SDN3 TaxID=2764720 RepID=UPI0016510F48|nr:DUF983 domain-containing protein [Olivibacter sp. SDN3]QNL47947.1 DUF983 domain-containing protein [Olivibacter sp. SDN3]
MKDNTVPREFQSALMAKCPRCRAGSIFEGKVYGLKVQKMNETCPCCNLRFEREPGYFYVSMFVSYAMIVAELVTVCIAVYFLAGEIESPWFYTGIAFATVVILAPFNYRYSRIILLYWLTPGLKFQPDVKKNMG